VQVLGTQPARLSQLTLIVFSAPADFPEMGAGKSKADPGAKRRSQGKVEDLEAGVGTGVGGGTMFVIPDAEIPAPPTTPYSPIKCAYVLVKLQS
jgi:hypothetical protein